MSEPIARGQTILIRGLPGIPDTRVVVRDVTDNEDGSYTLAVDEVDHTSMRLYRP